MTIHCDIVSQDRSLFSGDVDIVIAPGSEGELGILPNHTPLLTQLAFGILRVRQGTEEHAFTIGGGVMEVLPTAVSVLADVAESVDELDETRAEEARTRAEELLRTHPIPTTEAHLKAQTSLLRSQLRLNAIRKYRKTT
jgi:F-type H+-transporting ATPase subunit epsilon